MLAGWQADSALEAKYGVTSQTFTAAQFTNFTFSEIAQQVCLLVLSSQLLCLFPRSRLIVPQQGLAVDYHSYNYTHTLMKPCLSNLGNVEKCPRERAHCFALLACLIIAGAEGLLLGGTVLVSPGEFRVELLTRSHCACSV